MTTDVFRNYFYEKTANQWRKVKAESGTPGAVRPFIAGNWKMNTLPRNGIVLAARIFDLCRGIKDVDIGIAPPFTGLASVSEFFKGDLLQTEYDLGSNVNLLAQDTFFESKGAFTGEISAEMLKAIGVNRVIIGHSDRRANLGKYNKIGNSVAKRLSREFLAQSLEKHKQNAAADPKVLKALETLSADSHRELVEGLAKFLQDELNSRAGEGNDTVQRKVQAALGQGLGVILCIGENIEARDAGETFKLLDRQIRSGFEGISAQQMDEMVIAYEPVWAIGAGGKPASQEQIAEVHAYIRGLLEELYGQDIAAKTRVLYGGNVKPDNIAEIMSLSGVDGALVGGASLKAPDFAGIVKFGL